jgi:WS/DGAT/MGAT family acyltransferase
VPLGLGDPIWVDDEGFDVDRHVIHSTAADLSELIDEVLSVPLRRDRPLWEIWVADELADGRIGIVGKAHHCMVDGVAAVELASLLLDPEPVPPPAPEDRWRPEPAPGDLGLVASAIGDRLRDGIRLATAPAELARSPARAGRVLERALQAVDALGSSLLPAAPGGGLNEPISPRRHLARSSRRLEELQAVKVRFGTTLNDVLLAVVAGGLRSFMLWRGIEPQRLKTMVPVNVREDGAEGDLGNRISFIFVDLPCDEPDPVRRLLNVHLATSERKRRGDAQGGDAMLRAFAYTPRTLQAIVSRLVASPRTFNLVVSNIPGPKEALYMLGCELEEAYPVVPLADRHALSVGVTTMRDGAFFGLYSDRATLPDADVLAAEIDLALDELLERGAAEPELEPEPEPARV